MVAVSYHMQLAVQLFQLHHMDLSNALLHKNAIQQPYQNLPHGNRLKKFFYFSTKQQIHAVWTALKHSHHKLCQASLIQMYNETDSLKLLHN
jgi:hypothetical protein